MPIVDLNQSVDSVKTQLNALKTYLQVSKSSKDLKVSLGNSQQNSLGLLATQLTQISNETKRFQKNPTDSISNLLDFINITSGSGTNTISYLRKKILDVVVKIEPEIQNIVKTQVLKSLGCSYEQSYTGVNPDIYENPEYILSLNLNTVESVYIPISAIDIFSNLKLSINDPIGKIFYEKDTPSSSSNFIPFGGLTPFPMNKELNELMTNNNSGRLFSEINGVPYKGISQQNLFDIQYVKENKYGETGDFFKVTLINRTNSSGQIYNSIGEFVSDYYSTIEIADNVNITSQLINALSGAINIKSNLGYQQLDNQSRFYKILQRVLGLCFDNREEIDVSGIAKISELDGIDESFFELTDVDLRNIDIDISNIQEGVMEFQDCDNLKLPVNFDTLVNELITFRDNIDELSNNNKVVVIENIIDSINNNPEWSFLPTDFNSKLLINKELIKKLPLALHSAILSPKVLLPLFVFQQIINDTKESELSSQFTISTPLDFFKQFRSFNIEVLSRINEIFIRTLYNELKKDLLKLIGEIILDVSKSKVSKKYTMILRLSQIVIAVSQLTKDYRKCKTLIDDILQILKLLNGISTGVNEIPTPLLALTPFLPGTSPERATINVIEELQSLGIPTGVLPDGSPNLMLLYNLASNKGLDKENSENGKIEAFGIVPPVTGGYVKIFGKSF